MLTVGVEAGGAPWQCMVCPVTRTTPHGALYVVLWERDMQPVPGAVRQADARFLGGMVRLCREHADELGMRIFEALSGA